MWSFDPSQSYPICKSLFFFHFLVSGYWHKELRLPFLVLILISSFLRILTIGNIDKSICRVSQILKIITRLDSYSCFYFFEGYVVGSSWSLKTNTEDDRHDFRSPEMKTVNSALLCTSSPGPAKTSTEVCPCMNLVIPMFLYSLQAKNGS